MTTLRVGHGIDAHRLVGGRPLVLGGVTVPHERGLEGHSDGDVVAHALAEAVLGAAGLGDLGSHFPSSDPRWQGAESIALLAETGRMARAAGLGVISAQVVAICEAPRLAEHTAAMAQRLAAALGVAPGVITVAATSTDGLGMVGRGEGIAASAVALLDTLP